MKRFLTAIISVALASTATAASLTEKVDRTFDVRPGAKVTVANVNGRVAVSSWDQPRVRVVATKEVEGPKEELRKLIASLKVELAARDGGVTITTRHPKVDHGITSIFDALTGNDIEFEVAYEITVPRHMNVEVDNTNGSVSLANISGALDLETTNGKIGVVNCAGAVNASTTNGAIDAQLVRVEKKPMRFHTTNGRIKVALPASAAVDVYASTTNGQIESALPLTSQQTGRNSLRGSLNGGGTSLTLRTTNGGISISAIAQVSAK